MKQNEDVSWDIEEPVSTIVQGGMYCAVSAPAERKAKLKNFFEGYASKERNPTDINRFLKNKYNKRGPVFQWSEILADNPNMAECDKFGDFLETSKTGEEVISW